VNQDRTARGLPDVTPSAELDLEGEAASTKLPPKKRPKKR
jgi:hypothetical protein